MNLLVRTLRLQPKRKLVTTLVIIPVVTTILLNARNDGTTSHSRGVGSGGRRRALQASSKLNLDEIAELELKLYSNNLKALPAMTPREDNSQDDETKRCTKNATICQQYRAEGDMLRRAFINILGHKIPVNETEETAGAVTFVTQLSFNRFERVETVATHWQGSMSLAVYLRPADVYHLLLIKICANSVLRSRTNIFYHLSFIEGEIYPVNFLRNVALKGAQTPYVFLSDVDLIPSKGLDKSLTHRIKHQLFPQKTAWVIAAFEMEKLQYKASSFPRDKEALMSLVDSGHLIPFLKNFYPPAYNATDYSQYFTAKSPYIIPYEQEFEPYVVMRKREVPMYDRRLIGRIRDKASHLLEVHLAECSVDVFNVILDELVLKYPQNVKEIINYKYRFHFKPHMATSQMALSRREALASRHHRAR